MPGAIYHDNGVAWSHINSSAFEVGMAFHVTAGVDCTGLQWYRYTTGSGVAPEIVRLWRAGDTTELGRLTSVPDTGAEGWQGGNLADPITLVTGQIYIVSAYYPGSGGQPSRSDLATTPDSPVVVESNFRRYLAGSAGFPVNADSGSAIGADVLLTALPPDPVPATDVDLASWLSTDPDVQTHESDGLPWRTDANVTTLKGEAEGASGFAAIKGVVDTIATSVGGGLSSAVSGLTTALATANTALAHAATTWSDALATALQNMSDNFASFGASKPAQGGGITGAGTFPSNVGTLVWTMLDETDFAGSIAWAQPADVYVLSITTRPLNLPLNLTDGVHTIYRCGWWTPLNGSFGRQRSYIDFEDNHLAIGAERMPGVLVSLQPGGEGHLQAWALT